MVKQPELRSQVGPEAGCAQTQSWWRNVDCCCSEHAQLFCPSPSPRVCPSSCPMNRWCHPTVSSSVALFSFCLQSFPASEFFPASQLFASGGQSVGASASALPKSIQDWFPLRLTGLISLLSKGLSRDFSSTRVQKHQFFSALLSLLSSCHIHTWQMEWRVDYTDLCCQSGSFAF